MPLTKRMSLRLGELSLRRWFIGIAVLMLGISGAFGGWKKVDSTAASVPVVPVGQVVDGGPWKVTITKVQLHAELPPMRLSNKTSHWIVVVAMVEVIADDPWAAPGDIIRLSGVDGLKDKRPQTVLVRDSSMPRFLQPGMPEEVAFFWERSETAAPKEVTVHVGKYLWRVSKLDGTTGSETWLPEDAAAGAITAPVVDKRVKP